MTATQTTQNSTPVSARLRERVPTRYFITVNQVFRIAFFSNFKFTEVPTYCDEFLGQLLTLSPSWPQPRPNLWYSETPWPETLWVKTSTSGIDLCDSLFFPLYTEYTETRTHEKNTWICQNTETSQQNKGQQSTIFTVENAGTSRQTARSQHVMGRRTRLKFWSGLCSGADGRDTSLSQVNSIFTGTVLERLCPCKESVVIVSPRVLMQKCTP